ncbi:MAG TPA: DegT/DnrJ/EryC1/StrS family aminotransferase [Ktedonobacterales bacterium]
MIPVAKPMIGQEELDSVRDALESGQLAQGERVAAFERRFAEMCQVREAIAVSSGTAALHIALLAHGVGPGDEVITSPFSFAATANAVLLTGARPVFADIDPITFNLSPEQAERAITPRTKAIMPVHIYGYPAAMDRFLALAKAHNLALIEDACQAHLATFNGKPVGGFGTGCFSFYATKNMTTGEGGMVTTDDPEVAAHARLYRSHGQRERYVHIALGDNLRMTDFQGALGLAQLEKLPGFNDRRRANAAYLTGRVGEHVKTPVVQPGYQHVFHQYTIRARGNRDDWADTLKLRGIGTGVHYPRPIHQQPYFVEQGFGASLPVAERAASEVLSLPVHPALSDSDLERVADEVIALCK